MFCNLFFIAYAKEPLACFKNSHLSRARRGSEFTGCYLFVVFGPALLPLRLIVISSVTSAGSVTGFLYMFRIILGEGNKLCLGDSLLMVSRQEQSCGELSSTKQRKEGMLALCSWPVSVYLIG